jgi:hypothetical protein
VKDFVVVKTFSRYHAENPSQQEKFTVNRVAVAMRGVGAAAVVVVVCVAAIVWCQ